MLTLGTSSAATWGRHGRPDLARTTGLRSRGHPTGGDADELASRAGRPLAHRRAGVRAAEAEGSSPTAGATGSRAESGGRRSVRGLRLREQPGGATGSV